MKKTILGTIVIALTVGQRARLEILDQTDFSVFIKHANKELSEAGKTPVLSPEEAEYALKQYYALAVLNPNNMHAVSASVDPYWHSHVLHTHAYAQFCADSIGYFMHHDPLDRDDSEKSLAVGDLYGYTLDILGVIFKGNINSVAWGGDIEANKICWHFNKRAPDDEGLFPPDSRFEGIRRRYSLAAA